MSKSSKGQAFHWMKYNRLNKHLICLILKVLDMSAQKVIIKNNQELRAALNSLGN